MTPATAQGSKGSASERLNALLSRASTAQADDRRSGHRMAAPTNPDNQMRLNRSGMMTMSRSR